MIRKGKDGASEVRTPAEPVTLRIPTHMVAPSHGLVLREGPKPTRPRGRIPRVARLLALEEIFFLRPVTEGRPPVTERHLRQVVKTVVWSDQREQWAALRTAL